MPATRATRTPRPVRGGRPLRAGRPLRGQMPRLDDPAAVQAYNQRRLAELARQPQPRIVMPPVPETIEARYTRALQRVVTQTWRIVQATVLPAVQRQARADDDEPEQPELPGMAEVQRQTKRMQREVQAVTPRLVLATLPATEAAAAGIEAHARRGYLSVSEQVGLLAVEPGTEIAALADVWTRDNAALITSIPQEMSDRIAALVAEAVPQGMRWETLAKRIADEHGIADRRARLIARDQVSKYNGALNAAQQQAAGIEAYEWRGVMDARERPTHVALQGMVFRWDRPPPIGHPGEPIQCRCQAIPVFSRGLAATARDLTPEELTQRVTALGPTQREGPDATQEQISKRAAAEVASDVRLAQNAAAVKGGRR